MDLIKQLNWRYATKRMMSGQVVPAEKLNQILEAVRLAPNSFGLTPYSVFVISDKELLKKINATACPQPQLLEGSHLLVFAVWENVTESQVDEYMALVAETRGLKVADLAGYKKMIWDNAGPRNPEGNFNWGAKQAYLALGVGLTAAALAEVDATPMEGFDPAKMDEVLGLAAKGLKSVVLMMLGYRDTANDPSAAYKKVRRSSESLFTKI
jgi:nitroreductase